MSVKRCVLQGEAIDSLETLHDEIARQLNFPDYYGRNLDALWDVLSTDLEGPVRLIWEDADASRQAMGEDFERVVALLADVAAERDDFEVILR